MTRLLRATLLGLLILGVAGFLLRAPILTGLGRYLDRSGPPIKADAVFVLAGDASGNRILKGAELVREGYAPEVIVSGPEGHYGYYECDLAIPFAVRAGFPEAYFVRFPNHALSTRDEAAAAAVEFRSLALHRVLLVTSVYHTRRAGVDFRAAAPDLAFSIVAAPDKHFTPDGWWQDREARKIFLNEWLKTLASWFHL